MQNRWSLFPANTTPCFAIHSSLPRLVCRKNLSLQARQHGQVSQHLRHQLLPGRTHQRRQGPAGADQPLSQAQRPHERAAGGQEPPEDRRAHRLRQERVATAGN